MKEKCYTVQIPRKHKHTLLEDISKAFFYKNKNKNKNNRAIK